LSYFFENYELDVRRRLLLRGNERVQLTAKCFDLLRILIEAGGSTVTKDHLMEMLWSETHTEQSLTQHVFMLRQVLNENSKDHSFIVTVPKHGYKFAGTISPRLSQPKTISANTDAFHAYLKGCYLFERDNFEGYSSALECFTEASELDPSFAGAFSGIALAYNLLGAYQFLSPADSFVKARGAALHALALDPHDTTATAVLGAIALFYEWDYAKAEALLGNAASKGSDELAVLDNLAWISVARRRLDEALERAERTIEAHKSSLHARATLALVHQYRGDIKRAIHDFEAIRDVNPEFYLASYYLGSALVEDGAVEKAVEILEDVSRHHNFAQVHSSLAYALAVAGRVEEAATIVERLREAHPSRYVPVYSVAIPLVALGKLDEAMAFLDKGCAERSSWLVFLGVEPRFNRLRRDARFQSLIRRIGLIER